MYFFNFGEYSPYYKDFTDFVYNSKAYEKWLRAKTGNKTASVPAMQAELMEKARKTQEKFKALSPAEQRAEVMADFVGDTLFGNNVEGLKALTNEIGTKKHSKALQFILDFFSWLKKKFSGDKINEDLSLELSNIEEKFKRMVQDAAQNKEEYIKKRKEQRARIAEQQKNAQKNTTSEGDRFSVADNKITVDMSDDERANILKDTVIKLAEYKGDSEELSAPNVLELQKSYKSKAAKILKTLGEKFGVYKTYSNDNIDLSFDYSRSSLNESVDKQNKITTDFYDFAKMLFVFDEVIENAVPIEVHTDKYVGTKKENQNLKYDYVLLSAFKDGKYIIPVEFHVKELKENTGDNKLYVGITLGKIKIEDTVMVPPLEQNSAQTKSTRVSSGITIPDLVSKINPEYGNFYKYLPAQLLNEAQNSSRNTAIEDENYKLKVMRGEDTSNILREKSAEKGYVQDDSWKMDHTAPNSNDGYSNSMDKIDRSYGSDGSIYSNKAVYYYGEGRNYDYKAISVIKSAKDNPEKMITVYRAVPNNITENRVRNGDWVAIVKEYAIEHGDRTLENYRIIENQVPAKHLYSNGDSINEWGYDNGNSSEVYKNTPNNVKTLEVTYDNNGNVIPLSERFNPENEDIRYSVPEADEVSGKEKAEEMKEKSRYIFYIPILNVFIIYHIKVLTFILISHIIIFVDFCICVENAMSSLVAVTPI